MNDYERKIVRCVEEQGWFCTCVVDPDNNEPTFAYSAGFTQTLAAPECIIFGLSGEFLHSMLDEVYRQLKAGKQMANGESWSGLLRGFDCVSLMVHPSNISRDYLNSAMWLWGDAEERGPLPVYQMVWPDASSGLFPWEDGCGERVRELQPALYLPASS